MKDASFSLGGGVARGNAPACPSFFEQIKALESAARAADARRIERYEMAALAEDARICGMAAGEARLSCQKGNISRTYVVKNPCYYNRAAVALRVNIQRWAFELGRRYATAEQIAE